MDILVTRRLTLRSPLEVDGDAIFEALSNTNITRNLGTLPYPYMREHADEWIGKNRNGNNGCVYTIHRERLIGSVGVHDASTQGEPPVLGYWLDEPCWGKGYMTEAARAVVARAFRHYDTDTIRSYAHASNAGSLKVMDNLGFVQSGEGSAFNPVRNEEVKTIHTTLERSTFEQMFGSLETNRAA